MSTPTLFGWYHLLCLALTVLITCTLCLLHHRLRWSEKHTHRLVFATGIIVALLEVYKQLNFSLSWGEGGLVVDVQWYAFPWQFCSMPMYVSLLAGFSRPGRLRRALYAFLGSYAIFAGLCVMLYPADVFTSTTGINIQTMVCHGSMVAIGLYLLHCGCVPLSLRTLLHALPVFLVAISCAMLLNELAYRGGMLAAGHEFNMFYISPYLPPHLPVYSSVQAVVPYPLSLMIYVLGFTLASGAVLGAVWCLRCLEHKQRSTPVTLHS